MKTSTKKKRSRTPGTSGARTERAPRLTADAEERLIALVHLQQTFWGVAGRHSNLRGDDRKRLDDLVLFLAGLATQRMHEEDLGRLRRMHSHLQWRDEEARVRLVEHTRAGLAAYRAAVADEARLMAAGNLRADLWTVRPEFGALDEPRIAVVLARRRAGASKVLGLLTAQLERRPFADGCDAEAVAKKYDHACRALRRRGGVVAKLRA